MARHDAHAQRPSERGAGRLTAVLAAAALVGSVLAGPALTASPATAANPVTPGDFTGFGFDQCLAPSQSAMTAWLRSSPYWAVGVYIAGASRACREQPHLTPTWVARQLADGWRLLPIDLGPQASCNPRYPRHGDDVKINPAPANRYRAARSQGIAEAGVAVAAAKRLGLRAGSTLWYDMEAYDIDNTHCRESALWFTSAWTDRVHALGYRAGVYSSAGAHVKALDDARVGRPGTFTMPDRIWFARWDKVRTTSTPFVRKDGWLPGGRVKQYRGGHDETYGGVTINIDSNWLDLGRGSRPSAEPSYCGGATLSFGRYPRLVAGSRGGWVRAAQCLLRQSGHYRGPLTWTFDAATQQAVRRYRVDRGWSNLAVLDARMWTALLSRGPRTVVKYGGAGEQVRRVQRALNAATGQPEPVTGTFAGPTHHAVGRYQRTVGLPVTGVVTPETWSAFQAGRR